MDGLGKREKAVTTYLHKGVVRSRVFTPLPFPFGCISLLIPNFTALSHAFIMSSDTDTDSDSETSLPIVLHLGDVFAKSEWEDLAAIGELRVGRIQFFNALPFPLH